MSKIPTSVWIMVGLVISAVAIIGVALWANNRSLANVTLPLEITEYFDYQCTHCADFAVTLEQVKQTHGDNIKVNYRYYPFLSARSTELAQAAEAANMQGKFNEYHVAIFAAYRNVRDNDADPSEMDPEVIAQKVGLDMTKFNTDRNSDAVAKVVAAQKAEGDRAGVTGTPFVLVAGKIVETAKPDPATGRNSYQPFVDTIDRLIKVAQENKGK